jgi:hypothetical protein
VRWHRQRSNCTGMHRYPVAIDTKNCVSIDTISNNWFPYIVDYLSPQYARPKTASQVNLGHASFPVHAFNPSFPSNCLCRGGFFHTQALNMSSNYLQILTLASWPTPSHRFKERSTGRGTSDCFRNVELDCSVFKIFYSCLSLQKYLP